MLTGLAGCSVGSRISCGARKLSGHPGLQKKKRYGGSQNEGYEFWIKICNVSENEEESQQIKEFIFINQLWMW